MNISLKSKRSKKKDMIFSFDYYNYFYKISKEINQLNFYFKRNSSGNNRYKSQDIILNPLLFSNATRNCSKSLLPSQLTNTYHLFSYFENLILYMGDFEEKSNHFIYTGFSNTYDHKNFNILEIYKEIKLIFSLRIIFCEMVIDIIFLFISLIINIILIIKLTYFT